MSRLHHRRAVQTTPQEYVMIVDTETTGLPAARSASPQDYHAFDSCRIVQIAWALYNTAGVLQFEECYLIKPDGFTIPDTVIQIHGITNEEANAHGITLVDMFTRLDDALNSRNVTAIVAHNIEFDSKVILSELYRYVDTCSTAIVNSSVPANVLINSWLSKEFKCTMKMGKLPGQRWPKLVDLYIRLFGSAPNETLHRADADVRTCARVYFALQ